VRDLAFAAALLACLMVGLATSQSGCGGDDLVVGGMIPVTPSRSRATATPSCLESGEPCEGSSDCCSFECRPSTLTCR
jgi:hypothetical protein